MRFFLKNKVSTLINIIGLSIGLASCLLIYLFIVNELSYDKFQSKKDQIFRVVSNTVTNTGTDYNNYSYGNADIPPGAEVFSSQRSCRILDKTGLSERCRLNIRVW